MGLGPFDLPNAPVTLRNLPRDLGAALGVLLLAPLALAGAILHYAPYRAIGALASRFAGEEIDMLRHAKIIGGLLFYPLTWAVAAGAIFWRFGMLPAVVTLALAPVSGWLALLLRERWGKLRGRWTALALYLFHRQKYDRLVAQRRSIRTAIEQVAAHVAPASALQQQLV